jgi:hypothetical protein
MEISRHSIIARNNCVAIKAGVAGSERLARVSEDQDMGRLTARTARSMLATNDGRTAQNSRPKRHQIPEMMVCIGCRH